MTTFQEFVEYVCEQIADTGLVRYRKMFGDYQVYINDKPILLVCDNTVFVKILPELDSLMSHAEKNYPYPGAKEWYMLDIENNELAHDVVEILLPIIQVPKKKSRK
ncbi:MAG: TfoX/Sxy family protein [Bifidobacteriaceae bacterium]|jgi:TfoX/Sxy family transcriptional regulator of competence genes|nr:TfoX/Sxy family protein [Bifidobacteriaceae bacterium]